MLDVIAPVRPAGDLLSRVVRVTIGGVEYALPVRSIRANREFREGLDAGTTGLLEHLNVAEDYAAIHEALASQLPMLLDLLLAYDSTNVLPSKEAIEDIEPDPSWDIVQACREVWRAANPLVAMTVARMQATPVSDSSEPSSSRPRPTAGSRRKSRKN